MNNSNLPAVFDVAHRSPLQIRYGICRLEEAMRQALERGELQEREFEVTHTFHEGKYIRGMLLPKGSIIVGKLHIHEHPFTLWKGHMTIVTEHGGREELSSVHHGISPAGTKRAGYVHEDSIWTCEHETDLTDLDEIEAAVIAKSYTQLGWEDPVEQFKLARR